MGRASVVYYAATCFAVTASACGIAFAQVESAPPPQPPAPVIIPPSERQTTFIREMDGWSLFVDHSIGNGCFIARVANNRQLRIGIDRELDRLFILFGSSDWRSLETGRQYPVSFTIDQRDPWSGNAFAGRIGAHRTLMLGMEDRELLDEVANGSNLRLSTNGRFVADFSLAGTRRGVEALGICHRHMTEGEDPFAGQEPEPETPDPFGT